MVLSHITTSIGNSSPFLFVSRRSPQTSVNHESEARSPTLNSTRYPPVTHMRAPPLALCLTALVFLTCCPVAVLASEAAPMTLSALWNNTQPGAAIPMFVTATENKDYILVSAPYSGDPFGQGTGLYAYEPTGSLKWLNTNAQIPGPAYQINDVVVVDDMNDTIVGVASNGNAAWIVQPSSVSCVKPSPLNDGAFFFIDAECIVSKGVAATGAYEAMFNAPKSGSVSEYCFGSDGSTIVGIGASDESVPLIFQYSLEGTLNWVTAIGKTAKPAFTRGSLACLADGTAAFVDVSGVIHFVSASGALSASTSNSVQFSSPLLGSFYDGSATVAAVSTDGYKVFMIAKNGTVLWEKDFGFGTSCTVDSNVELTAGRSMVVGRCTGLSSPTVYGLLLNSGSLYLSWQGAEVAAPVVPGAAPSMVVITHSSPRFDGNSFSVAMMRVVEA